jgi:hypothetical protein
MVIGVSAVARLACILGLAAIACTHGSAGGSGGSGSGGNTTGTPPDAGAGSGGRAGSGGGGAVGTGGGLGVDGGTGLAGSGAPGDAGAGGTAGSSPGSGGHPTDGGADVTLVDAGDGGSPRDSGVDSDGAAHTLNAVMVVAGSGATTAGDNVMIGRLVARGFRVRPIGDSTVTAADVLGMDLVVISSSAESGPLGIKIRDVPVPIVCIENGAYPFMMMTGPTLNTDFGAQLTQTQVTMAALNDPLTAGLTGTVTISSVSGDLGWAVPGAAAIKAATIVGNPAHAALFGYAPGVQMVGMLAPARRVGFAIREILAANLASDGIKLFDAAVNWALQ